MCEVNEWIRKMVPTKSLHLRRIICMSIGGNEKKMFIIENVWNDFMTPGMQSLPAKNKL